MLFLLCKLSYKHLKFIQLLHNKEINAFYKIRNFSDLKIYYYDVIFRNGKKL